MKHTLKISEALSLPPETVTQTLVVYGGKGTGKTNFGTVLVEELSHAGLRWAVLDPLGVWHGIRHSKDGARLGIECLILGGVHGDIPIEPAGGAIVADLVVDEDVNVIIDFSRKANGETWGVGEKIRFATDYGKRLFQRQGGLVDGRRREPIFQVMDEAARFVPQMIRAGQPDLAMCLSVWAQIVEEGRNFGLGVCLLTQRSARLSKDVAELADAMFAFRTVGPNSIDAVMDWLGEYVPRDRHKVITEQLRSLPIGSCLLVSPGWLKVEDIIHIRERQTFDSSATPKPGERAAKVKGEPARPDLAKYAARMQETIQRQKENDPKELKARIRELEKALKERKPEFDEDCVKEAIQQALERQREEHSAILRDIVKDDQRLRDGLKSIIELCQGLYKPGCPVPVGGMQIIDRPVMIAKTIPRAQRAPLQALPTRTRPISASNGHGVLPSGEKAILTASAQYPDGADRDQLTVLTGYKRSTRDAYILRLTDKGYLDSSMGRIVATEQGVAALGSDFEPLPTGEALQDYWIGRLPQGEREILKILVAAYPKSVERESLEESTGFKRSTRDAYLLRMAHKRLVVMIGRGEVKASENLF